VNAVEKQIPDVIETLLLFVCPGECDGFAVFAAGEGSEGTSDMGIVGNEARRLNENAEDFPQFWYVARVNHASDGVEVFVGKTGACFVHNETEKRAGRETNFRLCRI
jgi:hypothetical protein